MADIVVQPLNQRVTWVANEKVDDMAGIWGIDAVDARGCILSLYWTQADDDDGDDDEGGEGAETSCERRHSGSEKRHPAVCGLGGGWLSKFESILLSSMYVSAQGTAGHESIRTGEQRTWRSSRSTWDIIAHGPYQRSAWSAG